MPSALLARHCRAGHRKSVRVVTWITAALLFLPHAALAQVRDAPSREVLVGTFTAGASDREYRAVSAGRMLDDGMAALEQGDVMLARRRLEVLVERYSETLAATAARQTLGELYRREQPTTSRQWSEPASAPIASRDSAAAPTPSNLHTVSDPRTSDSGSRPPAARAPEMQEPKPQPPSQLRSRAIDDWRLRQLAEDFLVQAGDRVFFPEGSADIGARARTVLLAQARWLRRHDQIVAVIEAHAADNGTREHDIDLAERRALAVRDRLIDEGVTPSRLVVRVYGRDAPIALCASPECAAQNRRVVTRVGPEADSEARGSRGLDQPAYATGPRRDRN